MQLSPDAARFRADWLKAAGDADEPALLAVSGGPDSMAMLALATEAFAGALTVATVDHGLRAGSADEAAMVAERCAAMGVPHATLKPDAPITGASLQAQARTARYALLAAHARQVGAACIATAHHADDQAETFLMRAARGSGLAGLAGVRARTVIEGMTIVRPLLDWRRAELRAIVRRAELPFVDDPSNHDDRYDRTRFRRLLDINEWLDPPHLARSAAALAEADADLRAVVDWLWDERAKTVGGEVKLAVGTLPREVLRRLTRRAIAVVRAGMDASTGGSMGRGQAWPESVNIERLLDSLMAGRRATQAGVVASVRAGIWRFREAPPRRSPGGSSAD